MGLSRSTRQTGRVISFACAAVAVAIEMVSNSLSQGNKKPSGASQNAINTESRIAKHRSSTSGTGLPYALSSTLTTMSEHRWKVSGGCGTKAIGGSRSIGTEVSGGVASPESIVWLELRGS